MGTKKKQNDSIEKRLKKMRSMNSNRNFKKNNNKDYPINKLNIIKKTIKIILIVSVVIIVIGTSIVGYFVGSIYKEWLTKREASMAMMADYYSVIVVKGNEKKIRYFNPLNPFGNTPPTRIYDKNSVLIGEYMPASYEVVNPEDISPTFEKTLLLMEDQKFYSHGGINYLRTIYLTIRTIISRKIIGGGSTITQQLAKLLFTKSERTIHRKLFEMFAAYEIESTYTKKEILAMYLNTVYLGDGNYGFEAASRYYFQKPLNECLPIECAILVGILNNPTYFSPIKNPDNSKSKVKQIFNRLVKYNVIDKNTAKEEFNLFDTHYRNLVADISTSQWKMTVNKAPYINEHIRQVLNKHFEKDEIAFAGLRIYSTVDIRHYEESEKSIESTISALQEETSDSTMQGAMVTIDPRTGAILSFIGGDGYRLNNQFNRAIQASRQIGSCVKPFIYAYAFEGGQLPFSIIEDKAYAYPQGLGKKEWTPRNYSGKHKGNVRLDDALSQSINTIAVKLLEEVGLNYFHNSMKSMLSEDAFIPHDLSIALGTIEISPLELAKIYSAFANNGTIETPYIIERIIKADGTLMDIEDISKRGVYTIPNLSPSSLYFVNTSLQKVLKPGGTAYRSSKNTKFEHTISAKTGTTSDYKDAWFVAYYDELVTVTWFGSDKNNKLPRGYTGGTIPAATTLNYLNNVLPNSVKQFNWDMPTDINIVEICQDSGLPRNETCLNLESIMLSGLDDSVKCYIDHKKDDNTKEEYENNSVNEIIVEEPIIDPTEGVIIN